MNQEKNKPSQNQSKPNNAGPKAGRDTPVMSGGQSIDDFNPQEFSKNLKNESNKLVSRQKVAKTAQMSASSPSLPDADTQSRRTGNSSRGSRGSIALAGIYDKVMTKFMLFYHAHVTYKKETLLFLVLLVPYVLVAVAMVMTPSIVFPNNSYAIWYKTITILVGLVATHATDLINERHAVLTSMATVISNEATIKTICDGFAMKGKNRLLVWMRNAD